MGPAEPFWGAVLVGALVAASTFAAARLGRALFPGATRAFGGLVASVLVVASWLAAAQLTGIVGVMSRWPLAAAVLGLAGVQWWLAERVPPTATPAAPVGDRPPEDPALRWAAWAAVLVAVAQWATAAAETVRRGFVDDDSIAYHLPFAARFAQAHDITPLHHVAPDQPISFYPLNNELVHGALMSLVGNDLLSPFVNLAVLGLLLLVAWCAGERLGRPHLSVALMAMLAASPLFTSHFPGSALVDVFGIALVGASVVVLLHAGADRGPALVVAGLAAGAAVGTKYTMVGPIGLLTIVVFVLCGRRWRLSAAWSVSLAGLGALWYVRNLVHVGNPVPPARIGLGPIAFEKTEFAIAEYSHSVASYLTDAEAVREVYAPGLTADFGRLWVLVLVLVAIGVVGAVVAGRDRLVRALGLVAGGSLVAYLLTPGAALGFDDLPDLVYFASAVRYGGAGIALALLLVAAVPWLDRPWAQRGVAATALVVMAAAHRTALPLWFVWRPGASRLPGLVAALVVAALGVAVWKLDRDVARRGRAALLAAVAAAALVTLGVANHRWDQRYLRGGDDMAELHRWAQGVRGARIATTGFFQVYALVGHDLSNHVQHVGQVGPRGSYTNVERCETWVQLLAEGAYDFVVVAPYDLDLPTPEQAAWTASIPTATPALELGKVRVFRFTGPVAGGCGAAEA